MTRRRRRLILGLAALWITVLAWPFGVYFRLYLDNPARPSVFSAETLEVSWRMAEASPAFYRHRFGGGPRIDELELEIPAKSWRRLVESRAEAMQVGVLFSSRRDLVGATLRHGVRRVDVKVRLKGDLSDHWSRSRWSLRVEVADGGSVRGQRRFSLHPPWARGFQTEPIFLELLRAAGFVAPRVDFVDLVVNGHPVGLMEIEEHFSAELLQHHGRPRGVLFKLDEEPLWRAWVEAAKQRGVRWSLAVPKPSREDDWRGAALDPFQANEIRRSAELSQDLKRASHLLRGVAKGDIQPSAAFDVDLWADYLAHCEVFGAPHMLLWNNLRFYFNPESTRLEPVVFDTGVLPQRNRRLLPAGVSFGCLGGDMDFADTLIADDALRKAFLEALRALDQALHASTVEALLKKYEKRYLAVLRTEYPWLKGFDLEAAKRRAVALRSIDESNFDDHVHPPRR